MSHRQHLIPAGLRAADFIVDLQFQAPRGRIRLEDARVQAAVEDQAFQAREDHNRGKQPRSQSALNVRRQTTQYSEPLRKPRVFLVPGRLPDQVD